MAIKNKNVLTIGLTGGIGTGKSTVSRIFENLGTCIVDADVISHKLTEPGNLAYQDVLDHFGEDILNSDKKINRAALRETVFSSPDKKKWLENLLHPLIRKKMREEIASCDLPYCICVIPLLAEADGIDFLDRVLVIESQTHQQRMRASVRDQTTDEAIQKIINSQASIENRRKIADDIIQNDSSLESLKAKVLTLHQQYLQLAKNNQVD